jgi:hypothetical protein
MRHLAITAVTLLGAITLAGCAAQQPAATSSAAPPNAASSSATDGTVSFSAGGVAVGVGYQWGSGTLTYQGRQYPFKIKGLSVVDVGVTKATGIGRVRNLRNVTDFNGNYVAASAGAALAAGGSATTLRNQNGVVIDSISTTLGARVTLAPTGVNITLSSP